MKLNDAEQNAFEALRYVVEATGVKVTSKSVCEQLYLNPDFPSLLSFSDVLNQWNVPNMAARIFREQLNEIPLPAVAYLEINGGYFAPIRKVTDQAVEWLDTNKGWQKDSLEEFYRKWNHVVLLIEPNEKAGEADHSQKRKEAFLSNARGLFVSGGLMLCLVLAGVLLFPVLSVSGWQYLALLATKLVGVGVSVMLLWYSIDANDTFLRAICNFDNRTDCNNILTSPAAKLWGWLGWSDIGFVYFAGGFVALLINASNANATIHWLVLLNFLALPYTFYSVYYQYFVAKTWCPLCLVVQVLFWVEFLISPQTPEGGLLKGIEAPLGGLGATLVALIFSFLLPAVLLAFTKKPLQDAMQVWPLKRELQKSKFNPEYVESLFAKQPQMPPIFEDMRVVKMGNATAEHTLTVVTNPICGPCIRLHPEIEALLQKNDALKCQFVFAGSGSAMSVAQKLLSLPDEQVTEAMHQWYTSKSKNVEEWTKIVNADEEETTSVHQLNIHADWCKMAEIVATPTIYLNGRQMPLSYALNDVETLCRILRQHDTLSKDLAESK